MTKKHDDDPMHGGAVQLPRSRGATSGVLLLVLGVWGALIPFVGPLFNFAFTPDESWHWTKGRGWLEVLPGAVVVLGGLLLLLSSSRVTTSVGGWLAVAGGAWFVVGTDFADLLHLGSSGRPTGSSKGVRLLESLTFFDGLGVIMVLIAALGLGRLSVHSVRDARAAQRRETETIPRRDIENDRAPTDNRADGAVPHSDGATVVDGSNVR